MKLIVPIPICYSLPPIKFWTCWPVLTRFDRRLDVQKIETVYSLWKWAACWRGPDECPCWGETSQCELSPITEHWRTHRRGAEEIRFHRAACFHRDYAFHVVLSFIQMFIVRFCTFYVIWEGFTNDKAVRPLVYMYKISWISAFDLHLPAGWMGLSRGKFTYGKSAVNGEQAAVTPSHSIWHFAGMSQSSSNFI